MAPTTRYRKGKETGAENSESALLNTKSGVKPIVSCGLRASIFPGFMNKLKLCQFPANPLRAIPDAGWIALPTARFFGASMSRHNGQSPSIEMARGRALLPEKAQDRIGLQAHPERAFRFRQAFYSSSSSRTRRPL